MPSVSSSTERSMIYNTMPRKKVSKKKCDSKNDSPRNQRITMIFTGIPVTATSRNIQIFSRFLAHGVSATVINNDISKNKIITEECLIAPTSDKDMGSKAEHDLMAFVVSFTRNMI